MASSNVPVTPNKSEKKLEAASKKTAKEQSIVEMRNRIKERENQFKLEQQMNLRPVKMPENVKVGKRNSFMPKS